MWQRFTERARKSVFFAQEEAQGFGEGYVSTEHLLLGILRAPDGVSNRVLDSLGVSCTKVESDVRKQLPRGDARPNQDMTLTPRAKRVIDLAYEEARQLSNNYIGTEHLLLGLVREGDGLAGRVLASHGVKIDLARQAVIELQDANREEQVNKSPEPIPSNWKHQMVMMRIRDFTMLAADLNAESFTLSDQLALLEKHVNKTLSEEQRNQLLGLCLELNEVGSLEDSDRWKELRLTKDQAENLARVGAELRKIMDS